MRVTKGILKTESINYNLTIQEHEFFLGGKVYLAYVDKLSGCVAQGRTKEEAIQELYESLSCLFVFVANRILKTQ